MEEAENKKSGGSRAAAIAVVVIAVCVCFIISGKMGIGALIGAGVLLLCHDFLFGKSGQTPQEEEKLPENYSFVDTAVLRRNFSIPQNLPIPYAVLDLGGRILMYNEHFDHVFPDKKQAEPVLAELFKKSGSGEVITTEVEGKFYDASLDHCDVEEENGALGAVMTMTMVEMTKYYTIEQKLQDHSTVIGILFLDNYEEVADALDENKLPILSALVDGKLNKMACESNGVLKKLEKDRYLFLISREDLEQLKEKKFDIMNTLRETSVGEHLPVTMSMGIGIGGESLTASMDYAKAALDLALGRGGSQVIIKEGEKFLFYGNNQGEMGKNGRIRARVKADALFELMSDASGILVMGHRNADMDSLGSCIGVCALARGMERNCRIVLDSVSFGIKKLHEAMMAEGSFEDAFISSADALRSMDDKTLVVILDTHRSSMVEAPAVLEAAKKVVVFDHHRKSADYIEDAVLSYHEPYASSTAELVTEMIQHMGKKLKLKPLEGDALLAGITVDTKNFCVKAGAITFEAAGFLRRNGADSTRVRLMLQNDMEAYRAKAEAVRNAELFMGDMAISVCPSNVENSTVTAAQAADDLMNVSGIRASFICCKLGDTVYVSARSFDEINVQRIMEKLGGGGHFNVSGAQLKNCTNEEAKEKIRQAITEYMEEEMDNRR